MKKTIILLALTLGSLFPLWAQNQEEVPDTTYIHKSVEIEKDYRPELKASERLNVKIKPQKLNVKEFKPQYSLYYKTLDLSSNYRALEALPLKSFRRTSPYTNYIDAGLGYPLNSKANAYLQLLNNRNTKMALTLFHQGLYTSKIKNVQNDLGLDLSHDLNGDITLYAGLHYRLDYYNYYGQNSILDNEYYLLGTDTLLGSALIPDEMFRHHAEVYVGIDSKRGYNDWYYSGQLNYHYLRLSAADVMENRVDLKGSLNKDLDFAQLNLDFGLNTAIYHSTESLRPTLYNEQVVFTINPSLSNDLGDFTYHFGFKASISSQLGNVLSASPDFQATYRVYDKLKLYAGIQGSYTMNDLISITDENPYWNPYTTALYNNFVPLDLSIGANFKPIKNLIINPYFHYAYKKDNLSYLPEMFTADLSQSTQAFPEPFGFGGIFNALYQDLWEIKGGLNVIYDYKNLYGAQAKFEYTHTSEEVYQSPSFSLSFSAYAQIIKNLTLSGDFKLAAGRKALFLDRTNSGLSPNSLMRTIDMDDLYTLNLKAEYQIQNRVSIFLEGQDLLSSLGDNEIWQGYQSFGARGLIGISYKF